MLPRNESSALSIMFIDAQRISYDERSDDPLFPATKPFDFGDGIGVKYQRPFRQRTILGCVDNNRWRLPSMSSEWYSVRPENWRRLLKYLREIRSPAARFIPLMNAALQDSSMALSIQRRGGLGLNASYLLENSFSLPLAKDQWKIEVRTLFDTSLARIQINLRNLARGTAAKYGARKIETRNAAEDCQGKFIFLSQGWQNVQVAGSVAIVAVSAVVLLLAIPLDDERLLAELVPGLVRGTAYQAHTILIMCYHKINEIVWTARFALTTCRQLFQRWRIHYSRSR